jgi:hypothetical protein
MKANKIIFAFKPHTDIQHVIYIYITEIQLEATRIVTGLTKISSLEALYFETGWDTLTERRRHRKLTFVRQIHNKSSPQYLSECLPPVSSDVSGYNFRNNDNYVLPRCRLRISKKSFMPSTVGMWNNLSLTVRN